MLTWWLVEVKFVNNKVVTQPGIYNSIFYNKRGSVTFNLVENPSTLIWAYLNVLYQARKFYINKRLDKVQGSYWIMRSLERVMTFQAAQAQNENRKDLLDTPSYESSKNQNKQIAFSMSRDDPTTESQKTEIDLTPSYTKAVCMAHGDWCDNNVTTCGIPSTRICSLSHHHCWQNVSCPCARRNRIWAWRT